MYQTDKELNPIKDTGCYFVSIIYQADRITKIPSTYRDCLIGFGQALKLNYIDANCLCTNSAGIFKIFGLDVIQKKGANGIIMPKDYICADNEIEILEYYEPRMGTHFVPGDGNGNIIKDVYSQAGSPVVKSGSLRSKRIFIVNKK